MPEAGQALDAIKERFRDYQERQGWPQPEPSSEAHVFMLPDETFIQHDYLRSLFEKALKKSDLLHDDLGAKRTLYSCRHTFATWQLLYGDI